MPHLIVAGRTPEEGSGSGGWGSGKHTHTRTSTHLPGPITLPTEWSKVTRRHTAWLWVCFCAVFQLRNLRFLSVIRPDLDNPETPTIQIWQEKVLHSPSLTYIDCYSLAACSEAVCYVIASTESCRPECTSSCSLHSPKDIHPLYYYSTYLLREQRIHNHKRSELSQGNTEHHQIGKLE